MSPDPLRDDAVSQISELLIGLAAEDALQNQEFRNVILDFIEQGGKDFHKDVSVRLKTNRNVTDPVDGPVRKRSKPDDGTQELINKVQQFWRAQVHSDTVKCPNFNHVARALQGMEAQLHVTPQAYESMICGKELTCNKTLEMYAQTNREHKVMQRYNQIKDRSGAAEGLRRITLIWVIYEIDRLQSQSERRYTSGRFAESAISAAERLFCERSGSTIKDVRALRYSSTRYQDIVAEVNGLGLLLLLGSGNVILWEREFSVDDVAVFLRYCKARLPNVLKQAGLLQPLACKAIEQRLLDCNVDVTELRAEGHILSGHFSNLFQQSTHQTDAGLHTLAAAAGELDLVPTSAIATASSSNETIFSQNERNPLLIHSGNAVVYTDASSNIIHASSTLEDEAQFPGQHGAPRHVPAVEIGDAQSWSVTAQTSGDWGVSQSNVNGWDAWWQDWAGIESFQEHAL